MRVLILLIIAISLNADIVKYPPLFAKVKGVKSDDILNVRQKPDYHSKRVGYLPNEAIVKVYKCKKNDNKSTWCKIGHMGLYDYEGYGYEAPDGWVNAKFLDFGNKGYVLVNNKGSCYYSLGCRDGICDVLIDIDIKKIKRENLLGVSRFDAYTYDEKESEDYEEEPCNPNMLYLSIPKDYTNKPKQLVIDTQEWIEHNYFEQINKHIHPTKGIVLTYYTTFNRINNHFKKNEFLKVLESDKKLYWGESEGKGEKIYMTLQEFFEHFQYAFNNKDKGVVKKVKSDKFYFPQKGVITYELIHKQVGHEWGNLVLVLDKYRGKYYIVGLLYNRWSI